MSSSHLWEINNACNGCDQVCWWPKGLVEPTLCLPHYVDPNYLSSPVVIPLQAAIIFGILFSVLILALGACLGIGFWKCVLRLRHRAPIPEQPHLGPSGFTGFVRRSFRRVAAFGRGFRQPVPESVEMSGESERGIHSFVLEGRSVNVPSVSMPSSSGALPPGYFNVPLVKEGVANSFGQWPAQKCEKFWLKLSK